jgi:hypothetical protein
MGASLADVDLAAALIFASSDSPYNTTKKGRGTVVATSAA